MNNTPKHTAGPWKIYNDGEVIGVDKNTSNGNDVNLCCMNDSLPVAMQESNARLIASAPELLQALKLAMATIEDMHMAPSGNILTKEKVDFIRKAIAKAEGGI